jgi:hypothetical protein
MGRQEDLRTGTNAAIYTSGDAGRTPATHSRILKKNTQRSGAAGYRYTAPTLFSVGGQKGIHIF